MNIHNSFTGHHKRAMIWLAGVLIVLASIIALIFYWPYSTPIPKSVTSQANFKAVYPSEISSVTGGKQGFSYQASQQTIVFQAKYQNINLSVAEQTVPDSLASGSGVYFQSLGLHPIAQFTSKLGPVAIVNFYKSGSLEQAGQSGILVAGKTMVVANTSGKDKLTNEQWKSFFDSLKQAK